MKTVAILAALSAASLIWANPAQEPIEPIQDSLIPVPGASAPVDVTKWAKALRNPDLSARKRAYESVLEEATRDEATYETVKAWAEDPGDVELAWTAQLMLRELDADPFRGLLRTRTPGRRSFGLGPGDHDDLLKQFEGLFDHYRDFEPWKDLQGFGGGRGRPGSSSSQGLSIEQTPDGVRVEVRESVDGEEQIQTYEAESMEALLEAHPELEEELGGRVQFRFGTRDPFDRLDELFDPGRDVDELFRRPTDSPPGIGRLRPVEPRTDVLGVQVLGPEAREQPIEGVPSHLGLQVVEVLPGSLASLAGVEVGDVVVSINGEEIGSAEDVKRVLAKRERDGPLKVEVVDAEGHTRFREWQPGSKEARKF